MRILLLDDSTDAWALFGPPLRRAFGKDVQFLHHQGEAAQEAARLVAEAGVQVVLVDGELEDGVQGYQVVEELGRRSPGIRCVGFSSAGSLREPFLSAGAIGFVQKDASDPEACIRRVVELLHS